MKQKVQKIKEEQEKNAGKQCLVKSTTDISNLFLCLLEYLLSYQLSVESSTPEGNVKLRCFA